LETSKYIAGFKLTIAIFCHEIDPPSCAFPYFWIKIAHFFHLPHARSWSAQLLFLPSLAWQCFLKRTH